MLGLSTAGVETLPRALLNAGLAQRLDARMAGRVDPPAYDDTRDADTLLLNPHGIARFAVDLADAIQPILDDGDTPVVLGGDCSILLGCALATRRRGRYGLLFLDGHADFYQPEAEPKGEAASMELALVTGRGPPLVTDLEGRRPFVRDEDVVALGRRDERDTLAYGSQRIEDSGIATWSLAAVREASLDAVLERAMQRLVRPELDGFWIHLDADALDDAIMPSVDYRLPDGLRWDEVETILRAAIGTGRVLGIDITIFNPILDADGSIARRLVDTIARGLT